MKFTYLVIKINIIIINVTIIFSKKLKNELIYYVIFKLFVFNEKFLNTYILENVKIYDYQELFIL